MFTLYSQSCDLTKQTDDSTTNPHKQAQTHRPGSCQHAFRGNKDARSYKIHIFTMNKNNALIYQKLNPEITIS